MNILALADSRPDVDIIDAVASQKIELIITLGDLPKEYLLPLGRISNIPKIGVYGNHDTRGFMPELGIWDMHCKVWDFQGLRFGGFEGCVRYKDSSDAPMFTQVEATQLLQGFPPVDVFISHCPPRGINDEDEVAHQGFNVLRDYLDAHHPKVWLHGHTYPTAENIILQHDDTRIEYVFKQKVIVV